MAIELVPLMAIEIELAAPLIVGEGPAGNRMIFEVATAKFEGERLRGTHKGNAGADWLTVCPDGTGSLDVRGLLETDDGALINMSSFGFRHGPADVLAALARGESVDPSTYYFRTAPRFETSAPPYAYLNRMIAIASDDRRAGGPIYTIEEIL